VKEHHVQYIIYAAILHEQCAQKLN